MSEEILRQWDAEFVAPSPRDGLWARDDGRAESG
jgi:hypothetical protein